MSNTDVRGFDNVQTLSLDQVKKEISFPILRENLISEDSSLGAGKDSVIREDSMETMGIISKRRSLLNYGQIMEWTTDEFDKTSMEYKLTESVVNRKGNLFQRYLFKTDVDNPDGQPISPIIEVNASYIHKPLQIDFGTYRFWCDNGAISTNFMESISIKSRDIGDLLDNSILNDLNRNMDQLVSISDQYQRLADSSFTEYLKEFLKNQKVPTGLKKKILYDFNADGVLTITVADDEGNVKLTSDDFITDHPENLYQIHEDKSGWDLYNKLTEFATHQTRSISAQRYSSHLIADVFQI